MVPVSSSWVAGRVFKGEVEVEGGGRCCNCARCAVQLALNVVCDVKRQ